MKRGTLILLVLVVGVLVVLWRARRAEERENLRQTIEPALFEGFTKDRIASIRIDHLERGTQVALERDAEGRWFLTDPVAYPAEDALARMILDHLSQSSGPIARVDDLEAVGLDPPRVVLETTATAEDGRETRWRVEVGALDLDARRVHVRVPGHPLAPEGSDALLLRVPRTLDTTLARSPDDYRDARATPLSPQSVVRLERSGRVGTEAYGELDVTLDAEIGAEGWARVTPPRIRFDPGAVGLVVRGATDLRVLRFIDDSPRDFGAYGLANPEMTVAVTTGTGERVALSFSRGPIDGPRFLDPADDIWYARREGFDHVWQVRARDVFLLATPDEFLHDTRLLRALRQDVRSIRLESGGGSLEVEREGEQWFVARHDESGASARFPASPAAVEDLIALLEGVELEDGCAPEEFVPESPPRTITVVVRDGARFGGEIGGAWRDPGTGIGGRLFRRHGDEAIQLLGETVAAACDLSLDAVRSLVVQEVEEFRVDRVLLTRGEVTQEYRRREKEWFPGSSAVAAPIDTQILIGELCHLRAAQWLGGAAPPDAPDPVTVRMIGTFPERERTFRFLETGSGDEICSGDGGLTARLEPGLLPRLRALFR